MRRNIVYKVAYKNEDGVLLSTNAFYDTRDYKGTLPEAVKLKYGVGKTTVPKVGKLFTFKTLNAAKNWDNISKSKCVIIKGYATNPTPAKFRLYVDDIFNVTLEDFWAGKELPYYVQNAPSPMSTMFCDSFTGLEVVK